LDSGGFWKNTARNSPDRGGSSQPWASAHEQKIQSGFKALIGATAELWENLLSPLSALFVVFDAGPWADAHG